MFPCASQPVPARACGRSARTAGHWACPAGYRAGPAGHRHGDSRVGVRADRGTCVETPRFAARARADRPWLRPNWANLRQYPALVAGRPRDSASKTRVCGVSGGRDTVAVSHPAGYQRSLRSARAQARAIGADMWAAPHGRGGTAQTCGSSGKTNMGRVRHAERRNRWRVRRRPPRASRAVQRVFPFRVPPQLLKKTLRRSSRRRAAPSARRFRYRCGFLSI